MSLIVHSTEPFNAEPKLARLRQSALTPQDAFYVRSHGAIPIVDAREHHLTVGGLGAEPMHLSMATLQETFTTRTVEAVMQCAGNRRADLQAVREVLGDPWGAGAIGNAAWTGVALSDVLRAAGAADGPGRHVAFTGLDEVSGEDGGARYAVSIPLEKALSPEVLVAWAMNGEPLTPAHGAPLRVVVPGYAGVRSAKWLASIEVRGDPAEGKIQRDDYKLFPADADGDAEPAGGMTIDAMPLNAAICAPENGACVAAGMVRVRGYAVAGERAVSRVDVSADGGRRWRQAAMENGGDGDGGAPWSWVFWEAMIDLALGEHELAVRAWDTAGQTQPASPGEVWNYKGYLCNAWHRVRVTVA